jgi:hypothetical protein
MEDFDALWQATNRLPPVKGIGPTEVLGLPAPLSRLVRVLVSSGGLTLDRFAAELDLEIEPAGRLGSVLVEKGYLTVQTTEPPGARLYRACLARTRQRTFPLDL